MSVFIASIDHFGLVFVLSQLKNLGFIAEKNVHGFFWLDINFLTLVLQKYIDLKIFQQGKYFKNIFFINKNMFKMKFSLKSY